MSDHDSIVVYFPLEEAADGGTGGGTVRSTGIAEVAIVWSDSDADPSRGDPDGAPVGLPKRPEWLETRTIPPLPLSTYNFLLTGISNACDRC